MWNEEQLDKKVREGSSEFPVVMPLLDPLQLLVETQM
jgi:hypothetical protein